MIITPTKMIAAIATRAKSANVFATSSPLARRRVSLADGRPKNFSAHKMNCLDAASVQAALTALAAFRERDLVARSLSSHGSRSTLVTQLYRSAVVEETREEQPGRVLPVDRHPSVFAIEYTRAVVDETQDEEPGRIRPRTPTRARTRTRLLSTSSATLHRRAIR
jgi:hypothetical protein